MLEYEVALNLKEHQGPRELTRVVPVLTISRKAARDALPDDHPYQDQTKQQLLWIIQQYEVEMLPEVNRQLAQNRTAIAELKGFLQRGQENHEKVFTELQEKFVRTADAATALLLSCTGETWDQADTGENPNGVLLERRVEDQ